MLILFTKTGNKRFLMFRYERNGFEIPVGHSSKQIDKES